MKGLKNKKMIGHEGREGQVVIYEEPECWKVAMFDEVTNSEFFEYSSPSIFIIEECTDGKMYYILRDNKGEKIKVSRSCGRYLYDAQEWMNWQDLQNKCIIKELENEIEFLKDIIRKGFVTEK